MLTKSLVPDSTKTLLLSFAPVAYPETHILWNAPRPLPGEYIEGPFIHGICYSHFDPSDRHAAKMVQECIDLDGWMVLRLPLEEIDAIALALMPVPLRQLYDKSGPQRQQEALKFHRQKLQGCPLKTIWEGMDKVGGYERGDRHE